jgi:AcrR family transcriptional regulator
MSIEGIAHRAKSSKATIYRRWPGKAELVADAVRRQYGPPPMEVSDTGTLRGDLLALTQLMCEGISGADGGLLCGLAVAVRTEPELGRMLAAHKLDTKQQIASLVISRAQERGELPPGAGTSALTDVAPAMAMYRQMSGEPLDREFAEHLVDNVVIPLLRS